MEYSSYKRDYVSTGLFTTLTGGSYSGFVNVLSGVPYNDAGERLIPQQTFETDVLTSKYFKDRAFNDTVQLPHDEDDVLLQPNDYLTARVFNDKITKIKENNIYLYSRMFMADNYLPVNNVVNYYGVTAANDTQFKYFDDYSASIPFYNSNYFGYLSGIRDANFATNVDNRDNFAVFGITDTEFFSLTGSSNNLSVIERSDNVESIENQLTFGLLSNLCRVNNLLYITDFNNNCIYKYDVGGYFNGDNALGKKRNLLEIVGGKGVATDRGRFDGPKQIATDGKYIIVNDSNNKVLKVYDLNFNFITTVTSVPLKKEELVAMQFNPFFNLLYIFTRRDRNVKVYIYDTECFLQIDAKTLEITLNTDEVVRMVEFSHNSSEYYYLCTSQEVYKFFTQRPNVLIGRYTEERLFNNINATRTFSVVQYTTETTVLTSQGPATTTTVRGSGVWNVVTGTFEMGKWFWNNAPTLTVINPGDTQTITTETTRSETVENTVTSMMNDVIKVFRILPTETEYDKIMVASEARFYFFEDYNNYKKVIKFDNLDNFGFADIGIKDSDYIHASNINKELYKVLRDLFAIKNNIVGRFSGAYDYSGIFTLSDYNYNVDFSVFNTKSLENYYVHENEKNLVGVLNRGLQNILELQRQILELTTVDKSEIVPVVNTVTTQYDNVYVL